MAPLIDSAFFGRVLQTFGFRPSLSGAGETVGRMERSTHRYCLTVDRDGSISAALYLREASAEIHFTRWPDGSTSLSGEAHLEPNDA